MAENGSRPLFMKKYLFFVFIIIFILMLVFVIKNNLNNSNSLKENKICINDYCFDVEIAKTQEERTRGLMYRESLDQDKGMLFIFDQEKEHSFWMKDTLIPLDIIWINKDMEIVYIEKNVQLCKEDPCERYKSDKPTKYVLELNAGQTDKANIKIGDRLLWK